VMSGQTFDVSAALVINASGAWIDHVRHHFGMGGELVQKSKGIHLVVDHIADSPLIMTSSTKGKVFFVIPIDSERTLVGTTDTPLTENPDQATAESRDVLELLQQLFYYFPYLKQGSNLLEAIEGYKKVHVRDVYWGVRPLLLQNESTVAASREHRLIKDLPRFWSFPGVKLTAGRAAGEEAALEAWAFLRKGVPVPVVHWDSLPGGELWDMTRFVNDAQKRFKLGQNSQVLIHYLISMYGTRYVEVLQWAQREPSYSDRIVPEEPWIYAQAAYAVQEEMVLTLNDFLWRRTKWAHYRNMPDEALLKIAQILGSYLDWTEETVKRQIADFQTELKRHRV